MYSVAPGLPAPPGTPVGWEGKSWRDSQPAWAEQGPRVRWVFSTDQVVQRNGFCGESAKCAVRGWARVICGTGNCVTERHCPNQHPSGQKSLVWKDTCSKPGMSHKNVLWWSLISVSAVAFCWSDETVRLWVLLFSGAGYHHMHHSIPSCSFGRCFTNICCLSPRGPRPLHQKTAVGSRQSYALLMSQTSAWCPWHHGC